MIKLFLKLLSLLYFLMLFYTTFLARRRNGETNFRALANFDFLDELILLKAYNNLSDKMQFAFVENFIGNIVLFIPFIPALVLLFGYRFNFLSALAFVFFGSLGIECMQYITNRGVFDISDILLNTFGGMLGFFVWSILCRYLPKHLEV